MPSKRKQTNMRLSDEATERLDRMTARMGRVLGGPVSHVEVVAAALAWMEYRIAEVEAVLYVPPGQPSPFKPAPDAGPADAENVSGGKRSRRKPKP